jgi:enolase
VIAPAVRGLPVDDQRALDLRLLELDGSPQKIRLGANALLGVSLAVAYAAAGARGEELFVHLNRLWNQRLSSHDRASIAHGSALPLPMVNMISGGLHAGRNLDIQDVLIIPIGASCYSQALEMSVAIYRALGQVLAARGLECALVGDEGGYGPKLTDNEEALKIVVEAIHAASLQPGRDAGLALDVASSHFFDSASNTYRLGAGGGQTLDRDGMIGLLCGWVERYPILSIEDGLAEDDWAGWSRLTAALGPRVQLIGDDLFVTQSARLERGVREQAGNAILIKVNQVGTLSETLDALLLARRSAYRTVVSARSGETEDATIADLAVATAAGQIKIGSVARSERLAKYNRLLRIEESLGPNCPFVGSEVFATRPGADPPSFY